MAVALQQLALWVSVRTAESEAQQWNCSVWLMCKIPGRASASASFPDSALHFRRGQIFRTAILFVACHTKESTNFMTVREVATEDNCSPLHLPQPLPSLWGRKVQIFWFTPMSVCLLKMIPFYSHLKAWKFKQWLRRDKSMKARNPHATEVLSAFWPEAMEGPSCKALV